VQQKNLKNRDEVARLLGVAHRSTLGQAIKSLGGEDTQDKLLAEAQKLVTLSDAPTAPADVAPAPAPASVAKPTYPDCPAAAVATPAPAPTPSSVDASIPPVAPARATAPTPPAPAQPPAEVRVLTSLDQVATGVSPLGVRGVVTDASWTPISGELDNNYRQLLNHAVAQLMVGFEHVQQLMAMQIQHEDPKVREQLQTDRKIGHQIDEMVQTLKAWAAKHPHRVVLLNDRQRESLVIFDDQNQKGGR